MANFLVSKPTLQNISWECKDSNSGGLFKIKINIQQTFYIIFSTYFFSARKNFIWSISIYYVTSLERIILTFNYHSIIFHDVK